jgi:RecB family exonuclease
VLKEVIFTTAAEMERALVDEALGGSLVLTATGRLARRIVDRCRRRMIETGRPGWEAPKVFAFRRFIGESSKSLWPSTRMPSAVGSLLIWHEAASAVPRPEGLELSPSLYGQLQQALDTLLENGVEPAAGDGVTPLPEWRRKVTSAYLRTLEGRGYELFPDTCRRVARELESGRIVVPSRVVVAGFQRMKPVEEIVALSLSARAEFLLVRAGTECGTGPDGSAPAGPLAQLYATPEQECRFVCAEVLNAWNSGKRNLGVVFLDGDYFPLLSRLFMELADREPLPENTIRFNIAGGVPLVEHPLYQTAVLPFRLVEGPRPHERLLSLLASPYAAKRPSPSSLREAFWGEDPPPGGAELLRRVGIPELTAIASTRKATVGGWIGALRSLWGALGFPALAGESDELAFKHLRETMEDLEAAAPGMETDAGGMLSWLNASARAYQVALRTPETAGIQILSLAESRGLSFSRLWVVGAHGRVLPQPARDTAFLSADEAARLPGSGYADRWNSAWQDVATLCAAAPSVSWSRSAFSGEDSPYLMSPIVRDGEGSPGVVDLWGSPPAAFMRARWLREGLKGLSATVETKAPAVRAGAALPEEVRVTALETMLECPFRYFAGELMGLGELEPPENGISSLEKGRIVHKVLEVFGKACVKEGVAPASAPARSKKLLEKACNAVFSGLPDDEAHRVERERLFGEDGGGLLPVWLDREAERAAEGWRFAAAEVSFKGLGIGDTGLRLRGKIDRIDKGTDGAVAVWDYKTGTPPPAAEVLRTRVRPQLPAYLLAVQRGLAGVPVTENPPLFAGYICMKRERDIKVRPLRIDREVADWGRELPEWEAEASARVAGPLAGLFAADPRPAPGGSSANACRYCAFPCLCGYFDGGLKVPDDGEGGEDD